MNAKDPQSIQELDSFIEKIKQELPEDFKFSFFVTKRGKKFLMGVWFLAEANTTETQKKEVSSEKARITKKLKQA